MTNQADRWAWSSDEIKRVGYRVIDVIAEHLSSLPSRPVFAPVPPELATAFLQDRAPEEGRDPEAILELFRSTVEPYPFGNGHPRFFGWVNSPPTVMGARHAKCGLDVRAKGLCGTRSQLVLYRTSEGHGCHQKAIELLGIGSENIRTIEHDDRWRMRPSVLAATIEQDRREGLTPMAVIASAGTVNTGAIDPLQEIAEVCQESDVWLHVDGAYGAPAILAKQYEHALAAIALADSVALDPHKWLCVPVEAGLVLIRHADAQRAAFSLVPPYLRTDGSMTGVGGPPWFSEYGFQQTRGFRALKVWMSLLHHGVAGYREAITRTLDLATILTEMLRSSSDFEVCEPQSLGIVCFRFRPQTEQESATPDLNSVNQAVLERLQLGGEAFVSSTSLNGVFWLRACVLNPSTTSEDLRALVDALRAAATP
ncbi:MAG: aminotransferase class V-fold PLP-dependent enzyme [Acidobacteria bacterium]|nr:aminotransferase class V-fold PLP-dependent enzyme [Acidobacteriota bacterium]